MPKPMCSFCRRPAAAATPDGAVGVCRACAPAALALVQQALGAVDEATARARKYPDAHVAVGEMSLGDVLQYHLQHRRAEPRRGQRRAPAVTPEQARTSAREQIRAAGLQCACAATELSAAPAGEPSLTDGTGVGQHDRRVGGRYKTPGTDPNAFKVGMGMPV